MGIGVVSLHVQLRLFYQNSSSILVGQVTLRNGRTCWHSSTSLAAQPSGRQSASPVSPLLCSFGHPCLYFWDVGMLQVLLVALVDQPLGWLSVKITDNFVLVSRHGRFLTDENSIKHKRGPTEEKIVKLLLMRCSHQCSPPHFFVREGVCAIKVYLVYL